MELSSSYFIDQWFIPSLVIFLLIGSVFAFTVGVGLIMRSPALFRSFAVMNRWVSMRRAMRSVEIPRNADAAMHRQSRILGAVFIVGAGLSLIALLRGFDVAAIVSAFESGYNPAVIETVARSAKWFLLIGDVLAILVGIAMIAVPQALAGFETRANQWVSTRKYDRNLDTMHMGVEKWAEANPRVLGWSILVLSVFVFVNLAAVVLSR